MIEKRNTAHKKNVKTVRDRNTGADIAEAGTWADPGHDDDEEGKSEEGEPEHEEGEGEGGGGRRKEQNCKNGDILAVFTSNRSSEEDNVEGEHYR